MNAMECCKQDLEEAIVEAYRATDSRGLRIMLVSDSRDPDCIYKEIERHVQMLHPAMCFISWHHDEDDYGFREDGHMIGKITAARNLALLSNLYHHALRYREYQRRSE